MKRDFRQEYKEYMNKKTPDLWSRIEPELTGQNPDDVQTDMDNTSGNVVNRISEEQPADKDSSHGSVEIKAPGMNPTEEKNAGKERKILSFRAMTGVIAAACVLGIGIGTYQYQANRSRNSAELTGETEQTAKTNASTNADTAANQPTIEESQSGSTAVEPMPAEADLVTEAEADIAEDVLYEDSNDLFMAEEIAYEEAAPAMASEAYFVGDTADVAYWDPYPVPYNGETYAKNEASGFSLVQTEPLSTFSADVDTASYANVRRMIEDGYELDWIDPDAVRPEEFINYFSYDLKAPENGEKFGVTTRVAACPWNEKHQLLFIGMKTEDIDLSEAPAENLTFLLDVSGSMSDADKLPLLQKSFLQLVDQLDKDDTISIVTYANGVEVVLDSVTGDDKKAIANAIEELVAEGGTNGDGGIQKAYALAEQNYREDANNRIILATDGDLNIGISEPDQLERFIREKKDKGIYLSVLGFGTGNIRDDNMERLADCGNGNYAYIDSLLEARKVMVEEMGASFHTVAEDVKLQVEFNPEQVNAYRLIGYENRLMDATDFRDDKKDAGEIGAGHSVIALYELIPAGSEESVSLKYQKNSSAKSAPSGAGTDDPSAGSAEQENNDENFSTEYATVSIRYKEPGETAAQESAYAVNAADFTEDPGDDLLFASAVAEFAMILRDDPNKGDASFDTVLTLAKDHLGDDEYRQEFYYMVRLLSKNS
ncbi:MAG: VWA domain-containing protein [Blautia sp.]|nr:VWA domain-containing protein [Blautia sp.]